LFSNTYIKAVNATTVEVTFKDAVENLNSLNFKIDGLTVSNAAVKQSDDKVVVLTTAVQKGGEKYTVTLNEKSIGTFNGVSAVIPTSIKLTNTSAQSKVGNQVILSAYVGAKEAGVPVTFNVDAPNGSLNKDQVAEVVTNADGIATYSYTQYSAGVDTVAVYPTGAPTTRDFATVYWGVNDILTVESVDATTTNVLANGSAKTYKVTYRNPVTGAVVANQTLNVTFAENMNVTSDKLSTAVVKDVSTGTSFNPYQLANGNVNAATVKTDSNGQATFTVSGTNTSATPIVFVDTTDNNIGNGKWDATELFATTEKLTFSGAQLANKFTLTATGSAQTATGPNNGRKYKVVVTDKDGKPYAGGVVNLGLNEEIDNEIATKTSAQFVTNSDLLGTFTGLAARDAKNQLKLNEKGEGEFILSSNLVNDYGTPVVWIDQNVAENHQTGVLENGEPSIIGEKTFFELEAVNSSKLTVTKAGVAFTGTFAGSETAEFTYHATNQSGNTFATNKRVTYTITNNGPDALVVNGNTANPIAAYGTQSVTLDGLNPQVLITTTNGSNGAVTVSAAGNVLDTVNGNPVVGKYLGTQTASAKFSKFADVPVATGAVSAINAGAKTFTLTDGAGKSFNYNYADSVYQKNGQVISLAGFESELVGNNVSVTKDANGKLTFNLIGSGTTVGIAPTAPTISTAGPVKTGDLVTISPAVPVGQVAWLAPAGTTTFVAGPTMTTAGAGATTILAPATEGAYKLFYVDTFGRSAASATSITVDNTAPTSTLTNAVYNVANDTIVITGTNFVTAGTLGADIKGQLDWSKLAVSASDDTAVVTAHSIALSDVTSAVVTSDNTLTITLGSTKATSLETAFGAVTVLDTLTGTVGFIKDAAGNVSTTDVLATNGLDN